MKFMRTPVLLIATMLCTGACGEAVGDVADGPLRVTVQDLNASTQYVHFTGRGDGLVGRYLGGQGTLDGSSASILFRRVPEGRKWVSAYGLGNQYFFLENYLDILPSEGYYFIESSGDSEEVNVVSYTQTHVNLMMYPELGDHNLHFGVENYILNSNYVYSGSETYGGSFDGANVTLGMIADGTTGPVGEDWSGCLDVSVMVTSGSTGSIGVFDALPAVSEGASWPPPESWDHTINVPLDGFADAIFYIVVKPGAAGHDETIGFGPGTDSPLGGTCNIMGSLYIRSSGYGGLGAGAQ